MKVRLMMITIVAFAMICQAQPSANGIIQKSLAYHDPNGQLLKSQYKILLLEIRPDDRKRETAILFNYEDGSFIAESKRDGRVLEYFVKGDSQHVKLDGSMEISEDDKEQFRIRPNRARFMRNYYAYLYGLPAKLNDPGTHISPTVESTTYQQKEVYSLKVTYNESVGSDVWYFYFDKETCALSGYRFHHDESKNDGEYITLEGEAVAESMKIPRVRKWYTNEEDKFLGTDTIVGFEVVQGTAQK